MDGVRTVDRPAEQGAADGLITMLGVVEGDILLYLDICGATPVRRLIRELAWPGAMVTMAVGALIREGLVRSHQHELDVIVEPKRPELIPEQAPEIREG